MFTIAIDLDSTVYDLLRPWINWYNEKYGDSLQPSDVTIWDWHKLLKPECGTKIYSYLEKKGLFIELMPFPGASEAIRNVHDSGIRQVFATACDTKLGAWEKMQAIERDFPFIGKAGLIVARDKSLVRADVLVDDGAHNIRAFQQTGGLTITADLYGAPHSRLDVAPDWFMTDWIQYPHIIDQLQKARR